MKKIRTLIILAAAAMLFSGCSQKTTRSGFYLDTIITVTAYGSSEAVDAAFDRCSALESLLSKTIEGSDIWRINHANGEPVTVSDETLTVIKKAIEVGDLSSGAFDITLGGVTELWNFNSGVLPDDKLIKERLTKVGYRQIQIDGSAVTLPAGVEIDLGGIAKGYIADELTKVLKDYGVKSALINLGGNIVAIGEKPSGKWTIGIQDIDRVTGDYMGLLEIKDISTVTSGDYQRYFDLNGIRYHHILDPKTGYPTENGLASVTIICGSSMTADALSTACFVLGKEKGLELIQRMDGVDAIFITHSREVIDTSGLYIPK